MNENIQIINLVSSPFGDYSAANSADDVKNHLLYFKAPVIDIARNIYLMGKMPWTIYQDFNKDETRINNIIKNIGLENPNFLLPDFITFKKNLFQSSSLENLLSEEAIKTYFELEKKRDEEQKLEWKKHKNIQFDDVPIQFEDIEAEYLWDVFGQIALAHLFKPITAEKNLLKEYEGFILADKMIFFYTNHTMQNNWHGPFKIDEYKIISSKILEKKEIIENLNQSPIFEVKELTIDKVGETKGYSYIDKGFQEIAKKYKIRI